MRAHPEYADLRPPRVRRRHRRPEHGADTAGVLVAALESGHQAVVKIIDGSPRAITAMRWGRWCGRCWAALEFERVEVLGGGVPGDGSPPDSHDQPLYEIQPYSY